MDGFCPNPGSGRLPSDSGRGDDEFASVFASVACLTVSFVPGSIFGTLSEKVESSCKQHRGIVP